MKDIRAALFSFLLADAAIYAAVEGNKTRQQGGSRVFPIKIPQGVVGTSIVYTRISGQGDHSMSGPSGLARQRIQVDAWATSIDAAAALANLIKDRLDGFRGQMGSGSSAVTVQGVFYEGERETFDDTASLHQVSQDFFIHFEGR